VNRNRRENRLGRSGLNAQAWDRLTGDSVRSATLPRALEESGSVGPAPAGRPRRSSSRTTSRTCRRVARLSEDSQPGRICVRPWLGRGVERAGRRILSQAPGRGAVHAVPGPPAWEPAAALLAAIETVTHRTRCRRRTSPSSTRPERRSASGAGG
jgi:hypothetical protein